MFALSTVLFGTVTACPSSGSLIHAGASFDVDFTNSCEEVSAEIKARASARASNGAVVWQDPHNHGLYSLLESTGDTYILTKRQTKNLKYTDKQDFKLTPSASGGCSVVACSNSQGLSAADMGTNFCDMFDLFCNSKDCVDGKDCCNVLKYDLQYTISDKKCWPFFFNCPKDTAAELKTCLKMPSTEAELAELEANAIHFQRMRAFDTVLKNEDDDHKGACNAADLAKNDEIVPDMMACFNMLDGDDSVSGVKACMVTNGFTASCSGCIADLGMCEDKRCQNECADSVYDPACLKCVGAKKDPCKTTFVKCSGLPKPTMPSSNPDSSSSDSDSSSSDLPTGSVLCPGKPTFCDCELDSGGDCAANPGFCSCAEAKECCAGHAPASSSSESDSSSSDSDSSSSDLPTGSVLCPGKPSDHYCDCGASGSNFWRDSGGDCAANPGFCSCAEAKECCAGKEQLASALASCTSGDTKIWDSTGKANFASDEKTCALRCGGQNPCTGNCISSKYGYSHACGQCFGALSSCVVGHCLGSGNCALAPNGEACKSCTNQHCTPAFESCTGWTPSATRTKTDDETSF